jgi:HAMP domain-containing protein
MSAPEVSAILIMLAVCAGLLLLLVWLAIRSARRLRRLERLLEARDAVAAAAPSAAPSAPRGEFETFLAEDPARQQLAKSEQFSAYRRWRRDKGLNWSKP